MTYLPMTLFLKTDFTRLNFQILFSHDFFFLMDLYTITLVCWLEKALNYSIIKFIGALGNLLSNLQGFRGIFFYNYSGPTGEKQMCKMILKIILNFRVARFSPLILFISPLSQNKSFSPFQRYKFYNMFHFNLQFAYVLVVFY